MFVRAVNALKSYLKFGLNLMVSEVCLIFERITKIDVRFDGAVSFVAIEHVCLRLVSQVCVYVYTISSFFAKKLLVIQ